MTRKQKIWSAAGIVAALTLSGGVAMAAAPSGSTNSAPSAATHKEWKGHNPFTNNAELLALLKTNANTLNQELKAGQSLADVASANGVDEQSVINLLVKQRTDQINKMVANGKSTQDKANQLIASLPAKVKQMVEQKGFMTHGEKGRGEGGKQLQTVASVLKMTPQDLAAQLKSGKSIAQVAQSKGISEQTVVDALVKEDTARITKFVESVHTQKHE